MFIPLQGFRHAAALLLAQGCRAIPAGSPPDAVASALIALARDLAALADDMRAAAESAEWLVVEYMRHVDQLPHRFDRAAVRTSASEILGRVASRRPVVEARDLFLVYVPEDRLPVAAPLAVELAKRRVTVALDHEVQTAGQLPPVIERGLRHHRAGVVLQTTAFSRLHPAVPVRESARLRLVTNRDPVAAAEDLSRWVARIPVVKAAGG